MSFNNKQAPVFIGTSGWYYDHWEGILYPPGLAKAKRFEHYVRDFNSVEINATFYRLPSNSMITAWYKKAPEDFIYVAKAHKAITHNYKLKKADEALRRFLDTIIYTLLKSEWQDVNQEQSKNHHTPITV